MDLDLDQTMDLDLDQTMGLDLGPMKTFPLAKIKRSGAKWPTAV